ncbi:MAG: hypothetical protein M3412_01265 [Chloroflexota bacterium]|jgi:hypothetical protein|nr:hypothetical protein [Chloroflexota bacterium]
MHDEVNYERRLWNLIQGVPDAELEGHIVDCAVCQRQLATLGHVARYARTTGGVDVAPPSALMTRLSGLMGQIRPDLVASQAPSAATQLGQAIRRVMATLVVDTGLSAQPAGLRSAVDHGHGTRQLVFESDVADLDLEVSRQDDSDDGWTVIGQLGMDHVPPGSTVSFIPADGANSSQESGSPIRVDIAVNGYFRGALPSGAWAALVEMDGAAVIFGEIRL